MTAPDRPRLGRSLVTTTLCFAFACGAVSLIYPFGRDQGSYAYAGWVVLEGGALYQDVFSLKPPMTTVVHALALAAFGVDTWSIRLFDIGWTMVTATVVAMIALELSNRRETAWVAGLSYPLLYFQLDYWNTSQTDPWMVLPMSVAVLASVRAARHSATDPRKAAAWWLFSGASAAIAVLFKYTAAAIALPILVVLVTAPTKGKKPWLGLPLASLGGALALFACALWLVAAGAWDAFLDSQLGLVAPYVERRSDSGGVGHTLRQLFNLRGLRADVIPLFSTGLLALPPALWVARRGDHGIRRGVAVGTAWWIAALASVVAQGKFFDYHYACFSAPAVLLLAFACSPLIRSFERRAPSRMARTTIFSIVVVLFIGLTPLGGRMLDLARVTTGQQSMADYIASRREYALPTYNVEEVRRVASVAAEMTTPREHVFVWSFEPTINVRAGRRTVSRFLYNYPFRMSDRYLPELMEALRETPPEVFIVRRGDRFPSFTGSYVDSTVLLGRLGELHAFLRDRYVERESVGRYAVWQLRSADETP